MIEIEEYLSKFEEPLPEWLDDNNYQTKPSFETLLKTRVVYYPGADIDGQPIKTFNKAHFAHVFFYVDYGKKKTDIIKELRADGAIKGYKLVKIFNYKEEDLVPHGWVSHYQMNEEEERSYKDFFRIKAPYCILAIFEREVGYDETHGAKRFAIVYRGEDAAITYDQVFANRGISASMIIIQEYMGNCSPFGNDGALHHIAYSTCTIPKYALVAEGNYEWKGYEKVKGVAHVLGGGARAMRWLHKFQIRLYISDVEDKII